MSNTYILQHTAEAIDHKLALIDENKNLLPYPYEYTPLLADDLTDVGDGSILTSKRASSTRGAILLNTFQLQPGTYKVSLTVTTLLDETVSNHEFSLSVTRGGDDILSGNSFTISESEQAIEVRLNIPSSFNAGWLIKPQIVKSGEDDTIWVPNMDKIGTYIDRRFNGTNAKIREISKKVESIDTLTEEQLTKILAFMDCIEINNV